MEADLLGLNDFGGDDDGWDDFENERVGKMQQDVSALEQWNDKEKNNEKAAPDVPPPPPPPPAVEGAGRASAAREGGRRNDGRAEYDGFHTIGISGGGGEDQETARLKSSSHFMDVFTQRAPEYEVAFECGPIGLELETDWYGSQACVKSFRKMLNGEDGPAKRVGVIRIGDVLTHVNDVCVLEYSFQETLDFLREVSPRPHRLRFKDVEAVGDMGQFRQDKDLMQARKFIHQHKEHFYEPPEESDDMVYCCVERQRGAYVTAFNLHREDTGQFIMACSVDAEMTGKFVFHTLRNTHLRTMDTIPQSEDSAVYLGCMESNFLGTDFTVHDHRINLAEGERPLHELGMVCYETNVLGRVPNFMKIVIPRSIEKDGMEHTVQRKTIAERYAVLKSTRRRASIMEALKFGLSSAVERGAQQATLAANEAGFTIGGDKSGLGALTVGDGGEEPLAADHDMREYGALEQDDMTELMIYQTKKPSWNEELCAWTLNFNGRVKQASKKNFLIVPEKNNDRMEDELGDDKVYLRFGKMSKTRFTCDFRFPMSPMMALAVASTAFAKKLAVT